MRDNHILLIALTAFAFLCASNLFASDSYMQVEVYFDSKQDYVGLQKEALDIVERHDDHFVIITTPAEYSRLQSEGYSMRVVHEDLTSFYQSRFDPSKDMGGYMTLSEIEAAIDQLYSDHPNIVAPKISLGQTIEGRDMYAFMISDNPISSETETEVLYTAAIHAREVITPMVLLNFADSLTENYGVDPEITQMVDNRQIWIVPCVNPDGYYHNEYTDPLGGGMWRKNRRNNGDGSYGVDLNRNFGYEWGYDNSGSSPYPSSDTYRGTSGFSEPETQNMRDFHNAHEFVITVYYHSHSNLLIYPWGYETIYTVDHDIFKAIGDTVESMNGYDPGTAWELLYPVNGSSDDWSYGEQTTKPKSFAVTFEVGSSSDGFWPPTYRIPALLQENIEPLKFLTRIAGNIYQLEPPLPPTVSVLDSIEFGTDYDVNWSFHDSLNPAVEYELLELQNYSETIDSGENFDYCDNNNNFSISSSRYSSFPSSFYSEQANNIYHYMDFVKYFPVEVGDTLRFRTWYDIELDWDYAYVEVSTDGTSFETIEGNITTAFNPNGNNHGHGITGSSSGWVDAVFDLSDYAGESITIRFSYKTDGYVMDEGFYVDDIETVGRFETETVYTEYPPDVSKTFSGKPVGEYFYKIRAKDAENQYSGYSPLDGVKVYDPDDFMCGDANGDGSVDVTDAVFMVNYFFDPNAPAPDPIESADVNCDGKADISDAVYIVNYAFAFGPEPCANCP